jgi:hypothetical protein
MAHAGVSAFGGKAAAPELPMQPPADLDPVGTWPVRQLIQPDLADPAAGRLLDRRPRPKAVALPLLQVVGGHLGDLLDGQRLADHDVARHLGVAEQPGEFGEVVGLPGP